MKFETLKKKLTVCAALAVMTLLTSCSSVSPVERVSPSGWVRLTKGQTFIAPRDITLAEEFVVQDLQQELLDTIEALRKTAASHALAD